MSDRTFQISLTAATIIAIALIVLLGIFWHWWWAVIIGIVYEAIAGGLIIHFWGKNYMERHQLT